MIASPAWQEGEAGKNAVQLFVYVVNPLSHHQQEALEYLIYEIANWPDYILAPMKADVEPVMSSSTYEIIAEHRQNAREWREKITDDLDEQSKLSYTRIAEAEEKLAQNQYDDIGNWNIYGPALESYRAYVMPNLFIQTSRLLEGSEQTHAPVWDELVKTVQQYMEGFTSLDQCVQRLSQIARALALEE